MLLVVTSTTLTGHMPPYFLPPGGHMTMEVTSFTYISPPGSHLVLEVTSPAHFLPTGSLMLLEITSSAHSSLQIQVTPSSPLSGGHVIPPSLLSGGHMIMEVTSPAYFSLSTGCTSPAHSLPAGDHKPLEFIRPAHTCLIGREHCLFYAPGGHTIMEISSPDNSLSAGGHMLLEVTSSLPTFHPLEALPCSCLSPWRSHDCESHNPCPHSVHWRSQALPAVLQGTSITYFLPPGGH